LNTIARSSSGCAPLAGFDLAVQGAMSNPCCDPQGIDNLRNVAGRGIIGHGFAVTTHDGREDTHLAPMTVFVYVNTSKLVGDPDHLKVFANADAAETWFAENDPEGVAFEYEVLE
jgi:hypothetical protein